MVTHGVAGVQLSTAKVARDREELVVLEHLVLERRWQSDGAQDALVHVRRKLVVRSSGGNLGVALLELIHDACGCVVIGRAVDALPEDLFPVEEDALDKLARVVFCVEEGHWRIGWRGKAKTPAAIGHLSDRHASKVGHEVTSEEECGWNTNLSNVRLDSALLSK